MTVEVIQDVAQLRELTPVWKELAQTVPHATPFQLPEWQLTWWSHFGSGQLHVMAFSVGSHLVGLMPGFLHDWEGRCQWTLLGTGISDYTDPLIKTEGRSEALHLLQNHLIANSNWTRCVWQDLTADSPLIPLSPSPAFDVSISEDMPCSATCFTGSFDQFWNSRSKDLRRNMRRYTERAEREGNLELTVLEHADPRALETLIRLHGERWQERGDPGMIAANGSAAFLCDVAAAFADLNMLRIFELTYKGKTAAIVMTFLYGDTIFSYTSAFDPTYDALGLGRNLLHGAFQYCFQNGIQTWNFLRGEEPYKASWGAKAIPKRRLVIERR